MASQLFGNGAIELQLMAQLNLLMTQLSCNSDSNYGTIFSGNSTIFGNIHLNKLLPLLIYFRQSFLSELFHLFHRITHCTLPSGLHSFSSSWYYYFFKM